jgi:tellurite resistance protein
VAADRRIRDPGLAHLHARAVLAIARADGEIELEEGLRLAARLEARAGQPVSLAELLLAEPLDPGEIPGELAAQLRAAASPFRGDGLHPSELAALIVADGIAVALAKGHVSEEEARVLLRFAVALGCSVDDIRRMSGEHLAPFLAALDESI